MIDYKKTEICIEMPRRIRVKVKNEILGDSVFWEGSAADIGRIHNVVARKTANLVAKDGRNRVCGMWHVIAS